MYDRTDEELMTMVARGHRLAFETLVGRHAAKAHAVAQRLLFSASEAEDATQDAFTRIWVNAARWEEGKGSFGGWFYRILVNICRDIGRKRREVYTDTLPDMEDERENIHAGLEARRTQQQVKQAISVLPERQQTALSLCYFEGFTNPEAAEIMGVHIKALEGLLVRARRTLNKSLAPLMDKPEGERRKEAS